jgi:hypothetical protein
MRRFIHVWSTVGDQIYVALSLKFSKQIAAVSALNDENGQFVEIVIPERDLLWLVGTQEG